MDQGPLVVIDGSNGLRRAVHEVFDQRAIQIAMEREVAVA
jgi:hypothetical protein